MRRSTTAFAARVRTTVAAAAVVAIATTPGLAQSLGEFVVTKMAEKTIDELPDGELYWHVENFGSVEEAEAAAGDFSLSTEFDDKAWLFTLAGKEADGRGGEHVTSIGPVPRIDASEYLLRINSATAPAGARTAIHTHPGPEAFLILSGQLTQNTPYGMHVLNAGGTMPGVPDQAMEVVSTGDEELRELIMFIVDPARPFSEPADLH